MLGAFMTASSWLSGAAGLLDDIDVGRAEHVQVIEYAGSSSERRTAT
jgi:hypothetical protein